MAPSGGWPRAGRASKGPPKEVPGIPPVPPWPDPANAGAGGGSKGGVSGGGENAQPQHVGNLLGAVTLRPRAPGREVCGRQTLRPNNKDERDDTPTGAGNASGGLPVGGEERGGKRRCLE